MQTKILHNILTFISECVLRSNDIIYQRNNKKNPQFLRTNLTLGDTLLKLQGVTAMEDSHCPCE